MGLTAAQFIAQMNHWQDFYLRGADLPVIGATEAQLRSIAVPTVVIAGNDRTHPRSVAFAFAATLPNAAVHDVMGPQRDDLVRTPAEEWDTKMNQIASIFIAFLDRTSSAQAAS
jgi:pimeloyl-ACP methyl ester carboxylesterase